MFAVGIDVSSKYSTAAVFQTKTDMVIKPFDFKHTTEGFASVVEKLKELGGEIKIVMECTGRYYEAVAANLHNAGFFVSAVNPLAIKRYQDGISVRVVKTDKADAKKLAKFALDNWEILQQYSPMDTIRYNLKTLNRQFQMSSKMRTALSNNLVALLETCYPGIRSSFDSEPRSDGSQKWVDFVDTFWHVDCVAKLSQKEFIERYHTFCKKHRYHFSEEKAIKLHDEARLKYAVVPEDDMCKMLVREAVSQLNAVTRTMETYRAKMNELASQLPEYDTVMALYAVGPSTGPQLMAEIGDIRRFAHQKSLVGFAGIDPIKNDSGDKVKDSMPTSKRGSPYLRKTLFCIMETLIKTQPEGEPVYQFLDKKRSEGKKYYVYMTAGMTKFLRIYYGKVRDALKAKGLWEQPGIQPDNESDQKDKQQNNVDS